MAAFNSRLVDSIICLIVVVVGFMGVFSWQNSKFNNLQKELNAVRASQPPSESALLHTKAYQALFLSNGQVYFGRITEMNQKYVTLSDIYYPHSSTLPLLELFFGTNPRDVSIIKLGCELHGPDDKMIINRDKIDFWENLKDDSEAVKAIKDYQRKNPKGQKCPTPQPNNNLQVTPSSEA